MSKISKAASRASDFVHGRCGALLLFILGCFVCVSVFKPYISTVNITDGGETQSYITLRSDPTEIMSDYGYALESADTYQVIGGSEDVEIRILRAFEVKINDAGYSAAVDMSEGTVADALSLAGIAMPDDDDVISPSADTAVYAGIEIKIDRVSYEETTEYQTVPYKTVKRETAELSKGETRVDQKGKNGEKKITIRRKLVNGELVEEKVISETVTSEAVSEIVYVGTGTTSTAATVASSGTLSTKPASSAAVTGGQFIDSNGRAVSYSKVLTGSGTAYTAEPGALTASGRPVEEGIVAVDPEIIPYGTRLYIVSADGKHVYGYALAADTGAALKDGSALVDVFYATDSQCHAFGRRDVIVYVLS